jgi:manganese/zinc/iron transport system permease protein
VTALTNDELWIFAVCAVCAAACALPGVFLMLRRESLIGDAISHSVLPGIVAAFFISGSRDILTMMTGAFAAGLLSVGISSIIQRTRRTNPDAAIGMTYTAFFAVGVLLLSLGARNVDIDPSCVLYGLVEFAPLDMVPLGSFTGSLMVPRSFILLSLVLVANALAVRLFWKELLVSTFDPPLARSLGFNTTAIHYGLMAATTVTIVASFESVGSILVITMLIAPAATGHLIAGRLPRVLAAALISATLAALGGIVGATALDTPVAGMMSVAAGALFFGALFFAPQNGIIARMTQRAYLRIQIAQEDILGLLYRAHESHSGTAPAHPISKQLTLRAVANGCTAHTALTLARFRGYVICGKEGMQLTQRGFVEAKALVRSHRLWESYLAKHLGLPADHVHAPSERAEHFIGQALTRELERELLLSKDPHGKKIP